MNYSAHTIIGIKIPKEKLYKEVAATTNMCICKPQTAAKDKFCSVCGKELKYPSKKDVWFNKEISDAFHNENANNEDTIRGYSILRDWCHCNYLFISFIVGSDHTGKHNFIPWGETDDDEEKFIEDMKELGVWDEELYGIWTVLEYA